MTFWCRPCLATRTARPPIGGAGIGILSTSEPEVKDAAYKFISYAAGAESNAKWFAGTGHMPINKHTKDQPVAEEALKGEPGITVAIEQLSVARGRPRPQVVAWMRASEYDMWQAMALGQHAVAQTLRDFASQTRAEEARTNLARTLDPMPGLILVRHFS